MSLRSVQHLPTALQAILSLRRGEVTCEDVVRSCLANVQRSEREVCAWEYIAHESALEAAVRSDQSGNAGDLSGVIVGVKDIIDTYDMPTSYGSSIYNLHQPQRDAVCVSRLRDSGGIVLGKTVTTEFAYLRPSRTSNPLDLLRTPGGSSSGSAAAVAEGMVPVALGTQTVGSLIRPAAFCGIVGFKPTFGKIPTDGVRPLAESLDTVGVLARSVEDIRLVLPYLMSSRLAEPASDELRICFAALPDLRNRHPKSFDVLERTKRMLTHRNIPWIERDVGSRIEMWWRLHRIIVAFEAFGNFRELLSTHASQLGEQITALAASGAAVAPSDYAAAVFEANEQRQAFDELLSDDEVLILPSTHGEAPPKDMGTGDPALNSPWTLLHVPTATIPVFDCKDRMPLGIQIVAKRGDDRRVLDVAAQLSRILQVKLPGEELYI